MRLIPIRRGIPIWARRTPRTINMLTRDESIGEGIKLCDIPAGDKALYMSSKRDVVKDLLAGRGPGPYGFRPGQVIFHLVLWNGRPVWVSSSDCELEEVNDAVAPG